MTYRQLRGLLNSLDQEQLDCVVTVQIDEKFRPARLAFNLDMPDPYLIIITKT